MFIFNQLLINYNKYDLSYCSYLKHNQINIQVHQKPLKFVLYFHKIIILKKYLYQKDKVFLKYLLEFIHVLILCIILLNHQNLNFDEN